MQRQEPKSAGVFLRTVTAVSPDKLLETYVKSYMTAMKKVEAMEKKVKEPNKAKA